VERSKVCRACMLSRILWGLGGEQRALAQHSPWTYPLKARIVPALINRHPGHIARSMPIVASLVKTTFLEAVRNRLLWLTAVVVVIAFALAQFLNQVALTETREIQTALLAAPLRASAVFILAAFVITSMVRESSDKVTELLLSMPVPRSAYFLGKFAGYASVALVLALLCALPLSLLAKPSGLALWTASLVCELLIIEAVSLFCVLTLAQVVPAFAAVAGFYLLSRSMTAMQIIASASLHEQTLADRAVNAIVDLIALLLPSLDSMTQTTWLLGSASGASALVSVCAQTGLYLVLICSAALFDLYRKNF
jgi:ABC-2 family transporter protein